MSIKVDLVCDLYPDTKVRMDVQPGYMINKVFGIWKTEIEKVKAVEVNDSKDAIAFDSYEDFQSCYSRKSKGSNPKNLIFSQTINDNNIFTKDPPFCIFFITKNDAG